MTILSDIGERHLISSIISKYVQGNMGDDCAYVNMDGITLALTTDPVPPPAAEVIGGDPNPFWKGWLLATINASDLAAAGAQPLGLLVAAEFPSDTDVEQFEHFFHGVSESCKAQGLRYLGGNLKEASRFSATATAIGTCKHPLTRKGAQNGDALIVVGAGGDFWCHVFLVRNGGHIGDKFASPLFAPCSQIHLMQQLLDTLTINAAMDNSDGLLSTVIQLASESKVGAVIELNLLSTPRQYSKESVGVSPQRLWLGWGDWNIVIAVSKSELSIVNRLIRGGAPLLVAGYFTSEDTNVYVKNTSEIALAPRIESERFARDSWFSQGIDAYIDILKTAPLPGGI